MAAALPIAVSIRVSADDFNPGAEIEALCAGRRDVGAVVSFVGLCRDDAGRLAALELQHYPGMAEAEIGRVVDQALARWPSLTAVTVLHRHGRIAPGERIVLVTTASPHRSEAFAAAEFLMDFLKTRAPFWKKEHPLHGTSGDWVEAKHTDNAAADRWRR